MQGWGGGTRTVNLKKGHLLASQIAHFPNLHTSIIASCQLTTPYEMQAGIELEKVQT